MSRILHRIFQVPTVYWVKEMRDLIEFIFIIFIAILIFILGFIGGYLSTKSEFERKIIMESLDRICFLNGSDLTSTEKSIRIEEILFLKNKLVERRKDER